MEIKKIVIGMIAVVAAFVGQAESSAPFRLSLKSDGVRTSLGDETLTYSSQWDVVVNPQPNAGSAQGRISALPHGFRRMSVFTQRLAMNG